MSDLFEVPEPILCSPLRRAGRTVPMPLMNLVRRRLADWHDTGAMRHTVRMKTISIRELHLETGRWVRRAASRGPIVVTDRGRRIAALHPFDASMAARPLPNREAAIRRRSRVPVDSVVHQGVVRNDRHMLQAVRYFQVVGVNVLDGPG